MASTTNYNWNTPDNSGLVKNGAQDIRTLGSAIDTSVWNIGFGQAGKNKIINGDFKIWQRGTSFNVTSSSTYLADRFVANFNGSGATRTVSRQTFTPGTAPVSGYEGESFFRYAQSVAGTSGTLNVVSQRIEDVRTLAGQTVTVSFWAKAAASTTAPAVQYYQNMGSGGSGDASGNFATNVALTTSWQRFSYSLTLPSLSGKTIGTSSFLALDFYLPVNATFTIDIWGVQLEAGSVATAFQTATGTIQGELAACQRYYQRIAGGNDIVGSGQWTSSTTAIIVVPNKVTMRTAPAISGTVTNLNVTSSTGGAIVATAVAAAVTGITNQIITITASSGVTGNGTTSFTNGANGILEMSSEL